MPRGTAFKHCLPSFFHARTPMSWPGGRDFQGFEVEEISLSVIATRSRKSPRYSWPERIVIQSNLGITFTTLNKNCGTRDFLMYRVVLLIMNVLVLLTAPNYLKCSPRSYRIIYFLLDKALKRTMVDPLEVKL